MYQGEPFLLYCPQGYMFSQSSRPFEINNNIEFHLVCSYSKCSGVLEMAGNKSGFYL